MKIWKIFGNVFNYLPIAAVIESKILCMHGGLSPDLKNYRVLRNLLRPTDVPDSGVLCDLLWSDPDEDVLEWGENE